MTNTSSGPVTRLGIIGVGQIGQRHLDTYRTIPGAEVVAICGRRESQVQEVAGRYGILRAYTDYRQLLDQLDIEAVDVCLHNQLHRPVTIAALDAGKDVYCEKPMAGTYADAEAMLNASKRTGRRLAIQLMSLFYENNRAARLVIEQGWLGRIYHASSTGFRRRGRPFVDGYGTADFVQKKTAAGGAVYDTGVYHIASMLHLLDNPTVERISGQIYQETEMDPARRAQSGYDVEEMGTGLIRLAGGVSLNIFEAWAAHLDQYPGSYLLGSQGGIRLDPFGVFRSLGDLDLNCSVSLADMTWRLKNVRCEGDTMDGPQQHWIASLQGRAVPIPTAELALNTMLISEGIYLSSRLGREVSAEEVRHMSVAQAE
ncbi:MAG TPA: Gfo/Idh/MocA family oxidoreductase [Anaerolineaceae bacterium]|jgi:predicted dehydrogenase